MRKKLTAACVALLTIVVVSVTASGCGGGSESNETSATKTSDFSTKAQARLDQQYNGSFRKPTGESFSPTKGLNVWVVSCGQTVTYCAGVASGIQEASGALGWNVKIIDTKADPALSGQGVTQAIAGGADAIVPVLIDCSALRGPLLSAKKAGVITLGVESLDCDVEDPSQPPMYSGEVRYVPGGFFDFIREYGAQQADWIIAKTKGKSNTLAFTSNEAAASRVQLQGAMKQFRSCKECVVQEVPFVYSELGNQLQAKASQTLIKNPDSDSIYTPTDATITGGVGPAVQSQGRGDMFVMGAEGLDPAPDLARIGIQQDAGVGFVPTWEGYAAIDGLARLEAGKKIINSGIGLQTWDTEHNLPPEGQNYAPPIDYKAAYRKLWELGD